MPGTSTNKAGFRLLPCCTQTPDQLRTPSLRSSLFPDETDSFLNSIYNFAPPSLVSTAQSLPSFHISNTCWPACSTEAGFRWAQNVTTPQLQTDVGPWCVQFLPQDKVANFARMTPKDLLMESERAMGDARLHKLHLELIEERNNLKTYERVHRFRTVYWTSQGMALI